MDEKLHEQFLDMVAATWTNVEYRWLVLQIREHGFHAISETPEGRAFVKLWHSSIPTEDEVVWDGLATIVESRVFQR